MKVTKSKDLIEAQNEYQTLVTRHADLTKQLRGLDAELEAGKLDVDKLEQAYKDAVEGISEGTHSPQDAAKLKADYDHAKAEYDSDSDLSVALLQGINGVTQRIGKARSKVEYEQKKSRREHGEKTMEATLKKLKPLLSDYVLSHALMAGSFNGSEYATNGLYFEAEKTAIPQFKQILSELE